MDRRLGRIHISGKIMRGDELGTIQARTVLFSMFHPYAIYPSRNIDTFEFYGWCAEFHEVPKGRECPEYDVLITRPKKGKPVIEFKRHSPPKQIFPQVF